MKKIIAVFVAIIATVTMCLAKTAPTESQNFTLKSDYTEISASQMVEVILDEGSKNRIRVEAGCRLMPYVSIVVKGSTLEIRHKGEGYEKLIRRGSSDFQRTKVYVSARGVKKFTGSGMARFVAEDITLKGNSLSFELSGMSKAEADRIECKSIDMNLSGMSKIEAELSVGVCEIDASGQCKVELEGAAGQMKIDASGMSKLSIADLVAGSADVDVSGMSKVDLTVNESVTGEVSGMSKLTCNSSADTSQLEVDKSSSVRTR